MWVAAVTGSPPLPAVARLVRIFDTLVLEAARYSSVS